MTRRPAPDFPVLDAPRPHGNAEFNRCIGDTFGFIEPFIEEIDAWVAMPLRLVYDQAAGWHLELGPYDLADSDIQSLRQAIAAYDKRC